MLNGFPTLEELNYAANQLELLQQLRQYARGDIDEVSDLSEDDPYFTADMLEKHREAFKIWVEEQEIEFDLLLELLEKLRAYPQTYTKGTLDSLDGIFNRVWFGAYAVVLGNG